MNELAAIPPGVLGTELDELVRERGELAEKHSAAWKALESAEASLSEAKQRDREAIAAAVRAGKRRPEHEHVRAVNEAIEQARDDLRAIGLAADGNEHDTLDFLHERRTDLLHTVSQVQEERRSVALEALEALSVALGGFGALDSLRRWLECPTTPASGKLQHYAEQQSFRLDSNRIRQLGAGGQPGVPVARVLDAIAERVESVNYLDTELLAVARAAGLERLTSVERRDNGSVALTNPRASGQPQRTIANPTAAGLARFVIAKQRAAVSLIVGTKTLDDAGVTDVFSVNRKAIDQAFVDGKRVVVACDDDTRAVIERVCGDDSSARETERQERVAESQRFQAEQRALRVSDLDELRAERETVKT